MTLSPYKVWSEHYKVKISFDNLLKWAILSGTSNTLHMRGTMHIYPTYAKARWHKLVCVIHYVYIHK